MVVAGIVLVTEIPAVGYRDIRIEQSTDKHNPTIGIVLCSDTDDDIARYSVMHGNEQLFATKYKLYMPDEKELKAEIEAQKAMFYLQHHDKQGGKQL